jgi:hypothetical protein
MPSCSRKSKASLAAHWAPEHFAASFKKALTTTTVKANCGPVKEISGCSENAGNRPHPQRTRLPLDFADARINAVLQARERHLSRLQPLQAGPVLQRLQNGGVQLILLVIQPNLTLGRLIGHDVARRALL